jgi:hypothetical protein
VVVHLLLLIGGSDSDEIRVLHVIHLQYLLLICILCLALRVVECAFGLLPLILNFLASCIVLRFRLSQVAVCGITLLF